MLIIPNPTRRRPPEHRVKAKPPPAALTLVAVTYVPYESVTLTFDRAIDAAGLDAGQVTVNDYSQSGFVLVGTGVASTPTPQSVVVALATTVSATDPVDSLTASAATGIVAADDGGTWAGVTQLPLPFP
jgi:hypothetical protein